MMTIVEISAVMNIIADHNRRLCSRMDNAPDFSGDSELDPTLNRAIETIHAADEIIATYPQGSFPISAAKNFYETTLNDLLPRVRARYGVRIAKPMEQAFRAHFALWYYEGSPRHPPELFKKKLFDSEDHLINVICDANCAIAESELPEPQTAAGKVRKRRGHNFGDRDPTLHKNRVEVVAKLRALHASGLSWSKSVSQARGNSAYIARMRGVSDQSWIRYAKQTG